MKLDRTRAREYLKSFDFPGLFTQCLGWDREGSTVGVRVEDQEYRLETVAEKRGVKALICQIPAGCSFPDYATRRKIDNRATRFAREHIIVYVDAEKTLQVWQWVRRSAGAPAVCREQHLHTGQTGEALMQRLDALVFKLEEEEWLTTVDVLERFAASGVYAEKVSKHFYDQFKSEHAAFLTFLKGVPDEHLQRWYASVMLNRLMFIYFIQKKGFLDGDSDYLKHKLAESKRRGKDRFYRDLLCPLFFKGFACKEPRGQETDVLLGKVPYLNGGIFLEHQIERECKEIRVADAAFGQLFEFFDAWQWQLDDRPISSGDEINPNVLGYIFEKYINAVQPGEQKDKGAYYTQEDITEYIGRNAIVPRLFEKARQCRGVTAEIWQSIWRLLQERPDQYIFEPMRRGVVDDEGNIIPESRLPDFVQKGMHDPKVRMFDKRYNLGDAELLDDKGNKLTLPTETWREYVARRQRCLELREMLASGKVADINDFVTLNLHIRQFAQDVIEHCDDPILLRAFWHALNDMSILDPTCGSGAFLFAALNILYPLYLACLTRMQAFVSDMELSGEKHSPKKYEDFKQVLEQVHKHPNERYFILKSIVVRNLYGVDIMDEAVEICKLRLFLKLVAQIDRVEDIEPLPDIDFNIRAGNTLVGFATEASMAEALYRSKNAKQIGLLFGEHQDALASIRVRLDDLRQQLDVFRDRQLGTDKLLAVPEEHKRELEARRDALNRELNPYLARWFAEDNVKSDAALAEWVKSHRPFHWIVEFYGIMTSGGLDVTFGNPPYVELNNLKGYAVDGYPCADAGNLYAVMMERAFALTSPAGHMGFIVPVSSVSTERYDSLQKLLASRDLHYSSYDDRPSRLFEGLEHIRLTIHLIGQARKAHRSWSTRYHKWSSDERQFLFQTLQYAATSPAIVEGSLPKLTSVAENRILTALKAQKARLATFHVRHGGSPVMYSRKVGYFLQVLDFMPDVRSGDGRRRPPSEFKQLMFGDSQQALCALGCLNSNLCYWFITVFSDCRHVNKREVDAFPVDLGRLAKGPYGATLARSAGRLMTDMKGKSERRRLSFAHDVLTVQCIFPKRSKSVIDEIDQVLAKHYGFTDEELDFIINYDIKYRMGRGAGSGEGEA